ncbi:hypothetical protein [Staphylococcus saprophyticus]|uniref:hypothetical protein n=1 Tax=Staphylococcus saprophyticus TaxID=29385 RepID=UPI0034C5CAB6
MTKKIIEAVITDANATKDVIDDGSVHYTNCDYDGKIKVKPRAAKELLKRGIVQSPHDFECTTKGCHAPVTCCSYRPHNKKDTYFMTPPEQRKLHTQECDHHIDHTQGYDEKESQKQYELTKGKRIVSTFNHNRGFEGTASRKNQETIAVTKNDDNESDTTLKKNVYRNQKESSSISKVQSEIKFKSVRDYVELYYQDPEAVIVSPDTGKAIKNKYLFTSIANNKLYKDVKESDYFRIYKAEITFRPVKNGDFIGWIKTKIEIDGQYLQPSLFLDKQFIEKDYPSKFEEYQENGFIECDIYLSYKLFFDEENSYLNFAQFGTDKKLTSKTPNLEYNIYLV